MDVAIVDAADEDRIDDHFPGVEVVRRIRALQGAACPTIVVVTGHFMNPGLSYRMNRAGADFYFLRSNLRSADVLIEVVLRPEKFRRGVPALSNAQQRRRLGLTNNSDVEKLLGYISEHDLDSLDGTRVRDAPRARGWRRHRAEIAKVSSIEPINITTGEPPAGQKYPSLTQLGHILRWAARVPPTDDGLSGRE